MVGDMTFVCVFIKYKKTSTVFYWSGEHGYSLNISVPYFQSSLWQKGESHVFNIYGL